MRSATRRAVSVVAVVLCTLLVLSSATEAQMTTLTQPAGPVLTTEGHSLQPWEHEEPGIGHGLRILGDDFLYLVTSPLRPTVTGLAVTAGAIAGVGLVSLADRGVRDAAGHHRDDTLHEVVDGISQLGNAPVLLGLNLLGVVAGEGVRQYTGDRTHVDAFLVATEAQILSLVMSEGLGYATARATPRQSRDPFDFKWGRSSFPSSHVAQTFAVATVLADRYGLGVGAVAYGAATAVGAARILQERHWSSDVAAGAVLGWAIGYTLSLRRSQRPPFLDFFPFADPGTRTYGFAVSGRF